MAWTSKQPLARLLGVAARIGSGRRAQAELVIAHRELRRRTDALTRTRARLVEAQELARVGSWEWDVTTDTVTWSDELYRIYGITPQEHEATFAGYLERVHEEDRERVVATIQSALDARSAFAFDERIVRPDGAIRTLASRGQVYVGAGGEPARMVGICQDVTDGRRAERALRESEERARLIVDCASDAFVATGPDDVVTEWNAQAQALFGWSREEALGRVFAELVIPGRNHERHRRDLERYLTTGAAPWLNVRLAREAVHRDGHEFLVELRKSAVRTEDGVTFHAFMHDISERVRRERELEAEHAVGRVLLEAPAVEALRPRLLDAIGTGLGWTAGAWWTVDRGAGVIRCTRFWTAPGKSCEAFERSSRGRELRLGAGLPGEVWRSGRPRAVPSLAALDDFVRREAAGDAGLTSAVAVPLVSRGEVVAVLEFFGPELQYVDEELGEMMARLSERIGQHIDRRAAEEDLREAQERFRRSFEDAGIGMALIGVSGDDEGRILEANDALCAITRRPRGELLGMANVDLVHPDDRPDVEELLHRLLDGEIRSAHGESRVLDSRGAIAWVAFTTSVVRDGDGRALYLITQLQDVTERKRFEGQLQHLAHHDPITGLFNRRRFEDELVRELASAHRYETGGAVLVLDLDHFKYVNDTLGHGAGDELIASVAEILRGRVRATDTVARLGGDEFAVVLPYVDERGALRVASALLEGIRRDAVVSTRKGSRRATASIGIALFGDHPGTGHLASEELLVEADIAMYDAKEAGRDRACVFDAGSSRQQSLQARMTWGEEIREALDEDRFTLFAQPIVPLQEHGGVRHELLVRMIGRDGELIAPGAFLPVAERFDLVQEIDRWVTRHAIELLAELRREGHDVSFEVNLSAKSLGDADLLAYVADLLARSGADPGRLVFEVTETAAIVNVDRAKQFARGLSDLGCGFALDDFGAGFASFYYLKHLPFDYLKIDGEFVEHLADSPTNQLVVQAVVTIARGLGKQTIAEYVSDEATLDLLRSYGVDYAQGFHVGRPVPVAEIELGVVPARGGIGGS